MGTGWDPKQKAVALAEGRVCCDCGRFIAKADVLRWKANSKRCWMCQRSVDDLNDRQRYEHRHSAEDKRAAEDLGDGSWVGD